MRYRILCVDDETANLRLLERLFRDHYEVITASSGAEALELLAVHDFAVIVSDQRMPAMTGMEFLKRAADMRRQTVRMMLTGYTDAETLVEAVNSGIVYKYITKPWINEDLLATVKRALQHYETMKAQRSLQLQNERLQAKIKATKDAFVDVVSGMLDLKDRHAKAHAARVRELSISIARAMRLDPAELENVSLGAFLHEVPMFKIPSGIVNKLAPYSKDEITMIEQNYERGLSLLEQVPDLQEVAATLRFQFEHYDGSGNPRGFSHDQIPAAARIISVANAFDTLVNPRGEQTSLSRDEALGSMRSFAGTLFDPAVVNALSQIESRVSVGEEVLELVMA